MDIESNILREENELKPNRYVARVMLYIIPAFILMELLNEAGLFHVNPAVMRLCVGINVVCAIIAQLLGSNKHFAERSGTKYAVLGIMFLGTFAVAVALPQWTELILALPLILSIQYHSRGATRFAIVLSLIMAALAAPVSVLFQAPQANFYEFLLRSIGLSSVFMPIEGFSPTDLLGRTFLYVSIPRIVIMGAFSLVAVYITKLVSNNIESRAQITYLSSTDILTGVLNRLSYEQQLDEYEVHRPAQLTSIYADADGLHELNNLRGHDAGDEMLKICAKAMSEIFGEKTYRIGGDEFVALVENDDMDEIQSQINDVKKRVIDHGYHMSFGAYYMVEGEQVRDLIREAEARMYKAKSEYYMTSEHDRRRR